MRSPEQLHFIATPRMSRPSVSLLAALIFFPDHVANVANSSPLDAARDDIRQYIIDLQSKTNEHSPEWQYKDFKKALPGGFAVVGTVTLARAADNSAHATVAHVEAVSFIFLESSCHTCLI
ncbi:hypothetical protein BOTBODRAFT_28717 [Botryobasidium botryosum FD-172 SS1]|uniref:Uncharacterized protein n=1 Tax=Botryobasidium botryosum (strain FD-172 SS1) TaxID=930990 RepID=A0A067MRF5_BOTB1|nr:hypothetical protein BOTBODRAFT_28717 [Botryobasidium botryosum FD-172 SS1]